MPDRSPLARAARPALPVALALALAGCAQPYDPPPFAAGGDPASTTLHALPPLVLWPQRAPAVPLVVRDPALSVWSATDLPTDDWPRTASGAPRPLAVLARIDGRAFRLLGPAPAEAPPLPLASVEIRPSRTTYRYAGAGVALALSFVTPLVPGDDDAMSLPGVFIELQGSATDGASHALSLYLDADPSWARGDAAGAVALRAFDLPSASGFSAMAAPGTERPYVEVDGAPDWGELVLLAPNEAPLARGAGDPATLRARFAAGGTVAPAASALAPAALARPTAAFAWDVRLGDGAGEESSPLRRLFLGHGRVQALRVDGTDCVADWAARGPLPLVAARALADDGLRQSIEAHDDALLAAASRAGGGPYAALIAIAYRQAWAGDVACHRGDEPLRFQLATGAARATSDASALYASAPLYLREDPASLGRLLDGFLGHLERGALAAHPFAPRDLGAWPTVTDAPAVLYGPPLEPSTELLALAAAHALLTDDLSLVKRHGDLLAAWAELLLAAGPDPAPAASTDDLTDEPAHAARFGLRAAVAACAWAAVEKRLGAPDAAAHDAAARALFAAWLARADPAGRLALTLDGRGAALEPDFYLDRLLGLGLAPASLLEREVGLWRAGQDPWGAPLDSRSAFTRVDRLAWAAALAPDGGDFAAMVAPIARMLADTPARLPFPDLWDASTAEVPFPAASARPVVAALFARLLLAPGP